MTQLGRDVQAFATGEPAPQQLLDHPEEATSSAQLARELKLTQHVGVQLELPGAMARTDQGRAS